MYREGIGRSNVGVGANFARSRLLLAKRAGYLPRDVQIDPTRAPQQWKEVSRNLARDAREAGFNNPLLYLRTGATQGGVPKPTRMRPGANANPSGVLPYALSRLAAVGIIPTGSFIQPTQAIPGPSQSGMRPPQPVNPGMFNPRPPQLGRLPNQQQGMI